MSNILHNKRYYKEIESELFIDEIILNKKTNPSLNKKTPNNKVIQSNTLLRTLEEFFNRYEVDDRKIISKKKLIISFKDLIYLIRESIIAQQRIDTLIYNDNDDNDNNKKLLNNISIQKIKQKYINDLSYNIFSFDKIDINYNFSIKKKTNNNTNENSKNKKINSKTISADGIKNEINTILENIYKEVFTNGNNPSNNCNLNQRNNNKVKIQNNLSKNKINNNSKYKSPILKRNISTQNSHKSLKNKSDKSDKNSNNTLITNNINNSINYNIYNKNISKSYTSTQSFKNNNKCSSRKKNGTEYPKNVTKLKKSKTLKNLKSENNKNVKNESKNFDIFKACENINNIKNSANKKILSKSNNKNSNDLNVGESSVKKTLGNVEFKDFYNNHFSDIIGLEELPYSTGIKKIIVTNTHKPSTLANRLLISGQKYIDDFKEMNENTKKRVTHYKY